VGPWELNLADVFARSARSYPARPALVDTDATVNFRELWERIERLAGGLAGLGIRHGDRVATLCGNEIPFVVALGACARLGAMLVPLNTRLTPPELRALLDDSGACALLLRRSYLDALETIRAELPSLKTLVLIDGDMPGQVSYAQLLETSPVTETVGIAEDDIAALMYTAAVDGRPRGAMMSHQAFVTQAANQALVLCVGSEDRYGAFTPLYHTAALAYAITFLAMGSSVVLAARFDALGAARLIQQQGITAISIVAPMASAILDAAEAHHLDLSSLRLIMGRESPMVATRFVQRNPSLRWLMGNYGQTETHSIAAVGQVLDASQVSSPSFRPPGGRETPLTVVRVVDEHDHEVPPGQVGELVVRGPTVARGYWNRPDVNQHVLRNGWWHTGDFGRVDPDGAIRFVARKEEKDLIKTGGENVYPVEVEAVLAQHPAVAEVCVIGVPDPRWSEAVKAIVVLVDERTASADGLGAELERFCKERIAGYKRPRQFAFVSALPHGTDGSVSRPEVKRRFG
jgi:long-chain acyl-CoA synthetase